MLKPTIKTQPSQFIYHYTSLKAFKNIIDDKKFRMTNSNFLNDPDDCRFFVKFVEKYLEDNPNTILDILNGQKNKEKGKDDNCKPFTHKADIETLFKNKCDIIHYINFLYDNIPLYVISFTELNDAMNLWNYYGKDGMQISFCKEKLMDILTKQITTEKEFLAEAPVIYIDSKSDTQKISKINDFALWTNNIYNVRKNTDTSCFVHSVTTYPCFFIVFRTLVLVHIL